MRRSEYAHLLADLTGVTEASVVQALERTPARQARGRGGGAGHARGSAQDKVEREMLKLLARDARSSTPTTRPGCTEEHFPHAGTRAAFVALREAGGDTAALAGRRGRRRSPPRCRSSPSSRSTASPRPSTPSTSGRACEEFRLKTLSDALRLRLQKLNPTTDPDYDELFRELVAVDGELRRLRQGQRDPV